MRTRQSFYEKPLLLFFLLMIFVSSTVMAQGAEKISMKLMRQIAAAVFFILAVVAYLEA